MCIRDRVKECEYVRERIITQKLKYKRGYIIIIGVYAPEEGKEEEQLYFIKRYENNLVFFCHNYTFLQWPGDF